MSRSTLKQKKSERKLFPNVGFFYKVSCFVTGFQTLDNFTAL